MIMSLIWDLQLYLCEVKEKNKNNTCEGSFDNFPGEFLMFRIVKYFLIDNTYWKSSGI